jgi:hypothetical protein
MHLVLEGMLRAADTFRRNVIDYAAFAAQRPAIPQRGLRCCVFSASNWPVHTGIIGVASYR